MWTFANSILRDTRALVGTQLKEYDLTPSEGAILLHLHLNQDAWIQDRIAEELEVSKPAISKAIDSLEQKGYVKRQQDPSNRRINLVVLTPKALDVGDKVRSVYRSLYAAAARGISEEEVELLRCLAERVATNLRAYREMELGA